MLKLGSSSGMIWTCTSLEGLGYAFRSGEEISGNLHYMTLGTIIKICLVIAMIFMTKSYFYIT